MEKKELPRDWSSNEIREAIKARGVTVTELAAEWEVSASSLYNAMKPSLFYWEYKELIAGFLGFSVEEVWPEQVALRQQKADRRAQSLLEAKALTVVRQMA